MKGRNMKWHILARHKWVVGALITESVNDDDSARRYTATVRGYRNWRIFEGSNPNSVEIVIRVVRAIRDQIDADGEDCEAFMAVNEYSHSTEELENRAEMFEHPISKAFDQWLETIGYMEV